MVRERRFDLSTRSLCPVCRASMPPGEMHVVARCNNREFYFAAPEDFEILLDHLGEMSSRGTVPDTFRGISLRNYLGQFCILKQLGGMGRSDELKGHGTGHLQRHKSP
jgi:hypothetical protein